MRARHSMIPLLVGLLFVPQEAWGQDAPSEDGWLTWKAPPECPQADHIEEQLRRWLGSEYDPARGEVKTWAGVSWRDDQWTVEVRLRRGEDQSTRRIVVGSCTEAADFVALSVALLVDPEFSPQETGEPAEPPSSTARDGETAKNREETQEPPPEETQPSTAELEPESTQRGVPPIALGAGVGLRTGVFALPSPLAFARVGIRPGGWRMRVGAASIPHLEYTPESAQDPAVFRSLVAQGEVCRAWTRGVASLGPCVGLEAGALSAKRKAGDATTLFWSAVQFAGEVEVAWGWGGVFLNVGAQIPFTQPEFVLEGGTVVHQSRPGLDSKLGFSILL